MSFTIGSLFDGSGGFPLAGFLSGGMPLWASEIEPYPIAVTKSRFPMMKHLGSVTDIKGNEVDPVDVITFGSPCQDLSVAGKRAGLKHEGNGDEETTRSGLFMEAIRIIKEMREATNGVYPRFAVWENVPGAFSSNKGEDFRIVLEEFVKIKEPSAEMPAPDKNGWPYADYYVGDGWSVAYRTLDAQFWGVPQRRRRIYLVADFGGERAGEILFERESLRGYFAEGGTPWETVTRDAESGIGAADCEGECVVFTQNQREEVRELGGVCGSLSAEGGMHQQNFVCQPHYPSAGFCTEHSAKSRTIGYEEEVSPTLRAGVTPAVCYGISPYHSNSMLSDNPHSGIYVADTSRTLDLNCGNPSCNQGGIAVVEQMILDDQGGQQISVRTDGKSPTLRAEMHGNIPAVVFKADDGSTGDVAPCLVGDHNNRVTDHTALVVCLEGNGGRPSHSGNGWSESDVMYTLNTIERHGVAYLASGNEATGCLMASGYDKLGAQEMFSGDYTVIEERPTYSLETFHCTSEEEKTTTLKARDYKDPTVVVYDPIALDRAYFNQGQNALYDPQLYEDGSNPTLVARGPNAVCVRYIVRRLTPTECARLQGFPDKWGHPDRKDELTDEEYEFWLNVRNTHAAINGKAVKSYSKDQMHKWYGKLHTDSSEYKMWGNGIALPNALYVIQGIAEVFGNENC